MNALFLATALGFLASPAPAPAPPATLTKEQIAVGLRKRRSDLDRFRATYTYRGLDGRGNLLQEKTMHFSRDGYKRLSDVDIAVPGRPRFKLKAAYDGTVSRQLTEGGHGRVSANKVLVADGYDALCMALHLPYVDETYAEERKPGQTFFLPSAIEQDRYLVLPEQQQVDGRWAHVLWVKDPENIFDAYWIDPDLDFAILKSENRKGDILAQRAVYEDHQQAGERVMPRRIFVETFGKTGRLEFSVTLTIQDIFVGEVPAETFELIFPPGTLVSDETTGRAYQIPGPPGAHFDKLSEDAKQEILEFQRRMLQRPATGARWLLWIGLPLGLGLGAVVLWRIFLRR